jgi:hypothetical protein
LPVLATAKIPSLCRNSLISHAALPDELWHHATFRGRLPNRHVPTVYSGASLRGSPQRGAQQGGGITMRARACTILGIWAILIAAPVWAAGGRYGTDYPVCMEALDAGGGGTHIDCLYTSIEQCKQGAVGTPGTCFNNPSYVHRPGETSPMEAEPAPKPGKSSGRYDPDYPVCTEVFDGRIECKYTSLEQCRQAGFGGSGTCFNNPSYVPRPAEVTPADAEPEPATNLKKNAGRYGTDYPVCMEALDAAGGTHFECSYTSIEQCRQGAVGTPGTCFKNPSYVPPPPQPASIQTESAPPAKPGKPTKPAKSAKSAKSLQSPPSSQPAQ